jgi:polyisoprenoid-binding protein YceI
VRKAMKVLMALSWLAAGAALAQAETYKIDSQHTFPTFEIEHLGLSTQIGRFNETRGQIVLDAAAKTGSVEVTVNTASIDTGLKALEDELRSASFFNVEKFPTMSFKSRRLVFDGDRLASVDGDLTLLGVTRPLTLRVESMRCATHPMAKRKACGGVVTGTLNRAEFGMTKFAPALLGHEVKLRFPVEALIDG